MNKKLLFAIAFNFNLFNNTYTMNNSALKQQNLNKEQESLFMNKSSILDYFAHKNETKNGCCVLNNINQEVALNLTNITHFQNINLRNKNTFKDIIFAKNQGRNILITENPSTILSKEYIWNFFASSCPLNTEDLEYIINKSIVLSLLNEYIFIDTNKNGILEIVTGPMYAGKTTSLIRNIEKANKNNVGHLCFSSTIDTRQENSQLIRSHQSETTATTKIDETFVKEFIERSSNETIKEIHIDEIQFFSPKFISAIIQLLKKGKNIFLYGLNLDSNKIPFLNTMPLLLSLADKIFIKESECSSCEKNNASYTYYLLPEQKNVITVGSHETYRAICKDCSVKNNIANFNDDEYFNKIEQFKINLEKSMPIE